MQDFISGAILVAFVGVLTPDIFPKMDIPTEFPISLGTLTSDDVDLQVGPPRLAGR